MKRLKLIYLPAAEDDLRSILTYYGLTDETLRESFITDLCGVESQILSFPEASPAAQA